MFHFGLAPDGVYMCPPRYLEGGGLLHHLSTLTKTYLQAGMFGGIFLLH